MSYDPWAEIEALEDERFEADMLMASYEEEGRRHGRAVKRMRVLYADGDTAAAAKACPHGAGFPLDSDAARNDGDPFAGEEGVRCSTCGSRLSAFVWDGGTVTVPMELASRYVRSEDRTKP